MSWMCPNCRSENAAASDYCEICACPQPSAEDFRSRAGDARSAVPTQANDSGPQITMTPEQHLRQLISEMLDQGDVEQKELLRHSKCLGIDEARYREIFADMTAGRNFGQATDIRLAICTKGELRAGKITNLCFRIDNTSSVEYERVSLAIFSNAYAHEPIRAELPRKLPGANGCKWFVPYQAPTTWINDAIYKIELRLHDNERNQAYCADTEIALHIGDEHGQASHIHIQVKDKGVLAGGIAVNQRKQTDLAIEVDSAGDFVDLPLFPDREFSQVTVPECEIADQSFDSCYLEITEDKVTRYVYLIGKPTVTMGRSSKCDIQVYHLDENGAADKRICASVSRDHCLVAYQGNRIVVVDSGSSQNHHHTRIVNMSKRLKPGDAHVLADKDILKIGALELKARLFPNLNHNTRCGESPLAAEDLYAQPQILWKEYGGYDKPGAYAALRLRYRNNPHHDEQYVLIYKYARFGTAGKIPIALKGQLPPVIGHFRFQGGRLFIENLCRNYQGLYLDGRRLSYQVPQPMKPGNEIIADNVRMIVKVED